MVVVEQSRITLAERIYDNFAERCEKCSEKRKNGRWSSEDNKRGLSLVTFIFYRIFIDHSISFYSFFLIALFFSNINDNGIDK